MNAAPPIIAEHLDAIRDLCRRHHVARLELFGSAAQGRFDAARSDLDFLVEFEPVPPGDHADAYFGLLEGMRELFACKIDLVCDKAISNPFFRKGVDVARTGLYAAEVLVRHSTCRCAHPAVCAGTVI